MLEVAISLLQEPISTQSASSRQGEAQELEAFAVNNSKCYDFTSDGKLAGERREFLRAILTNRLLHEDWTDKIPPDQKLRVLQCVRLILRDTAYQEEFVRLGGAERICSWFKDLSKQHFSQHLSDEGQGYETGMLVECASIVKKLVADQEVCPRLLACDLHSTLVYLLRTQDAALLPSLLVGLLAMAQHSGNAALIGELDCLHVLVIILADYDVSFKALAVELLCSLCSHLPNCREVLLLGGVSQVLSLVQAGHPALLEVTLRLLAALARDSALLYELRISGAVPILVSLVSTVYPGPAAGAGAAAGEAPRRDTYGALCELCSALTNLALDDETAYQIRQNNGVYVLGMVAVEPSLPLKPRLHVLRALRYIYSMDRNRRIFKRIFPPDLFAAFIDIGHYEHSLEAYAEVARRVAGLAPPALAPIKKALDDISTAQGAPQRTVQGYILEEEIGRGAFGCVYRVRKETGETAQAMKELDLSHVSLFGATKEERHAEIHKLNTEVAILSELQHVNIVHYYESFTENDCLYIVMELADGVPLSEFINSHAEKRQNIPESVVWELVVQMCLALKYIHVDKGIVHRDLTPSNVIVQHKDLKIKIADFGLAKQQTASTVMRSAVGTMPYQCPEIVKCEQYTSKADVWALGCILYCLLMLQPPFQAANPLTLASMIVEGNYPPLIQGAYSDQIVGLVPRLLALEADARPTILDVAALISERILDELLRGAHREAKLQQEVVYERDRRHWESSLAYRNQEAYRRLLSAKSDMRDKRAERHERREGSGQQAAERDPRQSQGPDERPSSSATATTATTADTTTATTPTKAPAPALTHSISFDAAAHRIPDPGTTAASQTPPTAPASLPRQRLPSPLPPPHAASPSTTNWTPPHPLEGMDASKMGISGRTGRRGAAAGEGSSKAGPSSRTLHPRATNLPSPSRKLSIASHKLRPINDPTAQMLTQLHKIMFIDQLPPGLEKDPRRRIVQRYKRFLFQPSHSAGGIKSELVRLLAGSTDAVATDLGSQNRTSYEELQNVIEELLQDHDYYSYQYSPIGMDMHRTIA